jgi:hypothetical protein
MKTNSTAATTSDQPHRTSEQQASKQIKQEAEIGLETYKKVKLLGKGAHGKAFLVSCGSDGVSIS